MNTETHQISAEDVSEIAERYYDSDDADQFYFRIWGGEDIHIGVYRATDEPVRTASERSVDVMAEHLGTVESSAKILDIGAGYGGAARKLAQRFGCHVTCLNLSRAQNARNRECSSRMPSSVIWSCCSI